MSAVTDSGLFALARELYVLRRNYEIEPKLYERVHEDIIKSMENLVVSNDTRGNVNADDKVKDRLQARMDALERENNILELKEAQAKVTLVMEAYVVAVVAHVQAEKTQTLTVEIENCKDEAESNLNIMVSELGIVQSTLE